jgi:hypothetical protein
MILGKVVKELLDVATPMVDCIVRDKAVRFHWRGPIASPQVPSVAADVGSALLWANRLEVAIFCEPKRVQLEISNLLDRCVLPDHELEIPAGCPVMMILCREQVIRDVRHDILGILIAPRNRGGHGVNIAEQLFVTIAKRQTRVGVTNDLFVGAGPLPGGVPLDALVRDAIDKRALAPWDKPWLYALLLMI